MKSLSKTDVGKPTHDTPSGTKMASLTRRMALEAIVFKHGTTQTRARHPLRPPRRRSASEAARRSISRRQAGRRLSTLRPSMEMSKAQG